MAENRYQKVIAVLNKAEKDISGLLTEEEDQSHLLSVTHHLQGLKNKLGLLTGNDSGAAAPERLGPATSLLGQPIGGSTETAQQPAGAAPSKSAAYEAHVTELYNTFLTRTNEELLSDQDKQTAAIIRGVAKKAGFTKKEAKESVLNAEFLDAIRLKIMEQQEAEEKKAAEAEGWEEAEAEGWEEADTADQKPE